MTRSPDLPAQPQQNPRAGRLITAASYVVGAVAAILFIIAYGYDASSFGKAGFGAASFVVLVSAFMLHQHGKRHLVPSALEVLAADSRRPILYLRSFDADEKASADEEVLAEILEEAGPFIAIGRPKDDLPPLGASRFYVADDHWRDTVAKLLDKAALVVLRAGKTHGLLWELRQCRSQLTPERICVLIPRDRSDYDAFRRSAEQAGLDLTLPTYPKNKLARFKAGQLAAILHFADDWSGTITVFERASLKGSSYEIATSATRAAERFRIALQPVAARSGLAIQAPKTNVFAMAAWSYMALVVLGIAILGFLVWSGYLR